VLPNFRPPGAGAPLSSSAWRATDAPKPRKGAATAEQKMPQRR
jgi:hypothetical protein